jgi:hypothetical protein
MTTATVTAPRTVRSRNPLWTLTGYEIRRLVEPTVPGRCRIQRVRDL